MRSGLVFVALGPLIAGCPRVMEPPGGSGNPTTFNATLNTQESTPTPLLTRTASGEGQFTLSADQRTIEYRITARGLTGPLILAHLHQAPRAQIGGIVVDLTPGIRQASGEVLIEGAAATDASFVAALLDGEIYVNLHTILNPFGEIRGQLEASGGMDIQAQPE